MEAANYPFFYATRSKGEEGYFVESRTLLANLTYKHENTLQGQFYIVHLITSRTSFQDTTKSNYTFTLDILFHMASIAIGYIMVHRNYLVPR